MRYRNLADQMITNIENGLFDHGQRMPSLRQLSQQFSVSMTTAINCYRNLEERGWIVARPQSGFYVSSSQHRGKQPAVPHFQSKAAAINPDYPKDSSNIGVSGSGPFGISQLSPSLTPEIELRRSLKRGLLRVSDALNAYPDPQGAMTFRQALATHTNRSGFTFTPESMVTTCGCLDAVRLALEVTTKVGEAVAISSPCFNGLLKLLMALSRRVVEIPSVDGGVDLQQLEEHMKCGDIAAALFSSSHMNPHGTSMSVAQKEQIAEIAGRYQTPVIEDDIYAELSYSGSTPLPVKYWDTEGYVLLCSSVSKTIAPGLRLGWCLPGRYLERFVQRAQAENLGRNSIVEEGVADFIRSGQYQRHLRHVRVVLSTHMSAYQALLLSLLPTGSAISQPQGGMVLWVQVPGLCSERFARACELAELDIKAGNQFSTLEHYSNCFRINFSWSLSDPYDKNRTNEQALRQLVTLL